MGIQYKTSVVPFTAPLTAKYLPASCSLCSASTPVEHIELKWDNILWDKLLRDGSSVITCSRLGTVRESPRAVFPLDKWRRKIMMAARLLRAFDLASSDAREQIILGIAERLSDDELQCFQTALERLERRFDVLCGVSKASGAQLPHEIQLQIVNLLDITDIYYCTNVCRKWRCLLLQCEQLTDDLLKKWLPALSDKGCQSSQLLHQAIRRRHLRDTGKFRTRQVNLLPFLCG